MRYVNLIIAALFAWSAILQYNDPDPWLWIAMYAAAAVMAGLAAFGRYPLPALVLLSAACLVWMGLLAGGVVDFLQADNRARLNRPVLFNAISRGVPGREMPAWSKVMNEQQIADVTEYVYQAFISSTAPEPVSPAGEH